MARSNGSIRFSASHYSDPSIAADGTIYFGAFDNNLYAFILMAHPNGSSQPP